MNRNNNLSTYVNAIPEEIKLVIKGLDNEIRVAILIALMKNTKLTFSELKECLGLNSSSLSSHLSTLQDGGLVNNFLEWNQKSYSYYMITDLAKTVLGSLFEIVTQSTTLISSSDVSNSKPTPVVKELWEQQVYSQDETQIQHYLELSLKGKFAKDAIESMPQYQLIKNPDKHSGAKNKMHM
jgi:DNA-binding transcriptional ArsR family regulator